MIKHIISKQFLINFSLVYVLDNPISANILSGEDQEIELNIDYTYWSERSACATHAALQTGCVANVVATKFVVFFSFFPLSLFLSVPYYFFSQKGLS